VANGATETVLQLNANKSSYIRYQTMMVAGDVKSS